MIQLVFSPKWFYGRDIIIDVISIAVLLLVSFFSVKYYRVNKNRNYLCLALSFGMLALSFAFKILMNFAVSSTVVESRQVGSVIISYEAVSTSTTLFYAGYFAYRLLSLLGLYALYSIYEPQGRSSIFLVGALLFGMTYFSSSAYYIYHATALLLLGLIVLHYAGKHLSQRPPNIFMFGSFLLIALSQVLFVFVALNEQFYSAGELVQLVGYGLMLAALVTVLGHARKKVTS